MRDDPHQWLSRAKSCLIIARTPIADGVFYEDLCYQAQQAAEKALKAMLWLKDEEPPRIHDIAVLLKLSSDVRPFPPELIESAALTDYAVRTRYPDDYQAVDEAQYARAIELASRVVTWAECVLGEYARN